MKIQWTHMPFWKSGEWQVIQERLQEPYNPGKTHLFRPMSDLSPHEIKVAVFGQDPYPDPSVPTGTAFDIMHTTEKIPPSFVNLLKEYVSDLGYPYPTNVDLSAWIFQGVFLWNVIPTCTPGKSMSHDWPEWEGLNRDLISLITKATEPYGGVVWVFLGSVARRYTKFVSQDDPVLEYSHPSPRGAHSGKSPFIGSRMFSTINGKLSEIGRPTINWRLSDALPETNGVSVQDDIGRILERI